MIEASDIMMCSGQALTSVLDKCTVVDLTQPLFSGMPLWLGDPEYRREAYTTIEADGYGLNAISFGEHSGTHFGSPSHFVTAGRSVESYVAKELLVQAVVIDIREVETRDRDYRLTVEDVQAWEERHSLIPGKCVVLLLTGRSRYWSIPERYFGLDEAGYHWPGYGSEAVEFLITERNIAGLGIDTHGIDPGDDKDLEANQILLSRSCFHLENLANLELLPPTGSHIFIGVLPIVGGTGSPARVSALFCVDEELSAEPRVSHDTSLWSD